jgi:Ca2+-binding RTX toxin-like protein
VTTYNFSALSNGQVLPFNPLVDVLYFDLPVGSSGFRYLANELLVSQSPAGHLVLGFATLPAGKGPIILAKSVTLSGMTLEQVTGRNDPVNIRFASGGMLIVGDDVPTSTNDHTDNSLVGTDNDDMLLGLGGADVLSGRIGNDFLDGGSGDDTLYGDSGDDKLYGGAGNDRLDGGSGNDLMVGGTGHDTYEVDTSSDIVVETIPGAATGGIDTVRTIVNYTLTANVETLILVDRTLPSPSSTINNISGTGNTLDNTILGNSGFNTLDGGTGADIMKGGSGDDVYVVDDLGDVVIETDNSNNTNNDDNGYILIDWVDLVQSSISYTLTDFVENLQLVGSADLDGTGNALDNIIHANTGDNVLNGGANSLLSNGVQNPDEYAALQGDTVSYLFGATAGVTVSLALSTAQNTYGSGVDTLIGFENLTGSAYSDELTGDAGNNVLNGGSDLRNFKGNSGADILRGGDGNDSYIVDGSDTVIETNASLTQIDTVFSWVDFRLPDNVENLRLLPFTGVYPTPSSPNSNAIGNALNNSLIGNAGNNILDGGGGADKMYGGAGDDTYIVDHIGDVVNETLPFPGSTPGGTDTVRSSISYTLGAGIEKLQLMGSANLDGKGNELGNFLWANRGNNLVDGAVGTDTLSYEFGARSGITIDLRSTQAQATGGSGFDTLLNIENLTGSSFNDFFIGTDGNNVLDGGRGIDTVSFAFTAGKVSVTLGGLGTSGSASGGCGSDSLLNFENVIGSAFDDSLVGTGGNNLIDGGAGNDTVSYETATPPPTSSATTGAGVVVNLATTTVQNTGGSGYDTLLGIENVTGSKFDDQLIGTNDANVLNGLAGADTLSGGAGNDLLDGGAGDDFLDGGSGTDTLSYKSASSAVTVNLGVTTVQMTGGSGDDTVRNVENLLGSAFNDNLTGSSGSNVLDGGAGNDTLDGGAGTDTLSYESRSSSVIVNLGVTTAQAIGGSEIDTAINFENLIGGSGNDTLTGSLNNNVLDGGAGNDSLDGGNGIDTLSYETALAGVSVSLGLTAAQATGGSGTDTIKNFENLVGSTYNDILSGNADNNVLDGGAGSDTVAYQSAASGVTVNLALTTAQVTGGAGTDTLKNFENLIGSGFGDTLVGTSGDNVIDGGAGSDSLDGGAGIDTLSYRTASIGIAVSLGLTTAQITGGSGSDTVKNFENLIGSALNDTLTGSSGDNVIDGGAGSDSLDGGDGTDTLSYQSTASGVTLNLGLTTPQATGGSGTDTVKNFENLIGSSFGDTLVGTAGDNVIDGGAGSDSLDGGAGIDTLSYRTANIGIAVSLGLTTAQITGGSGSDTVKNFENLIGSAFNDTLSGNVGDNLLDGGAGIDTLSYAAASAAIAVNLGLTTAQATGGAGTDTIANFENLTATAFNDTVIAGAGDNVLDGGAGIDTLSYASASAAVKLNLGLTTAQATGGSGTDTITNFENLVGSAFNDTVSGTAGNNLLEGGAGSDTLSYATAVSGVTLDLALTTAQATGGAGTDTVSSFENLVGSSFNDTLTGNASANVIDGGGGSDLLDGGSGTDTLSYASASGGVAVNLGLTTAQVTGGSGTDSITNFENLTGSGYDDILTGNAGNNTLTGGAGADLLDGGVGSDLVDGGTGVDTLTYQSATGGVTLSLALTTAQATGGSGSDTVKNVENLLGSAFNDTLTGTSGSNVLDGGAGSDVLDGGTGTDTLSYASAGSSIKLSLALTTAQVTGGSGSDTVKSFENLRGSGFNDTLTGSSGSNVIDGGAGSDVLDGGSGTDTLSYQSASGGVTLDISLITAQLTGGSGTDTVKNFENLLGSRFNDNLTGNAGNNVIEGGAGYDILDGKGGTDTVSYQSATSAVTVDLSFTVAQATGGAGTDTMIDFENLLGSGFNDFLTGNRGDNVLTGGAGNDVLTGGLGTDSLTGGTGADTFVFESMDSGLGAERDVVTDFLTAQLDKLDVRSIDANSLLAGQQTWAFIGTAAFSDAAQVRFDAANHVVQFNDNANLAADFEIGLTGVASLAATDFLFT